MPDRLGRDTLSLLELINRLDAMEVDLKVLDMPVDAQDVAGGGQPVALVTAGVGPGGGQAGRAALEHHPGADTHHTLNAEKPGPTLAQISQGQGVSESLVRRVLKVEDVEALAGECLQERLGSGGRRKRDRHAPLFQRQGRIASVDLGLGEPFSLLGAKCRNYGHQS